MKTLQVKTKPKCPIILSSNTSKTNRLDYSNSCNNKEEGKRASEAIKNRILNELNDLFSGIVCLEGTFSLQVKEGSHSYNQTQTQLNKALIWLIHSSPTLNDILLRITWVEYLTLIDARSGYYNLKHDEKSSYLMTFSCPFHRCQYIRLPFGAPLVGNMFQKKIDKLFDDYLKLLVLLRIFWLQCLIQIVGIMMWD